MRKKNVIKTTGRTSVINTRGAVATPAVLRRQKKLVTKVREAQRLIHTISQLTDKLA